MKVEIDVNAEDMIVFEKFLNEDEGLREGAVRLLLQQNKPSGVLKLTTIVSVLGRISKGFSEAMHREMLRDPEQREVEVRELARVA